MTMKIQKPGEKPYGLPYDDMHKGYVMPVHEVEETLGHARETREFRLGVMNLTNAIERELAERGEYVTVVSRKDAICVLTDADAADHNAKQADLRRRGVRRAFKRLGHVDVANLSEEHRERHQQNLTFEARLQQAERAEARKVRKELAAREEHAQIEGK